VPAGEEGEKEKGKRKEEALSLSYQGRGKEFTTWTLKKEEGGKGTRRICHLFLPSYHLS